MNLIYNERWKLLAITLNNLGVGAILAGIVAPLVNGIVESFATVAWWCILGVDLIALAQVTLGRLR